MKRASEATKASASGSPARGASRTSPADDGIRATRSFITDGSEIENEDLVTVGWCSTKRKGTSGRAGQRRRGWYLRDRPCRGRATRLGGRVSRSRRPALGGARAGRKGVESGRCGRRSGHAGRCWAGGPGPRRVRGGTGELGER